jgi:TatD DNase family protein
MAEFDVKNITIGTAITTSRDAITYAENHADTWCAVGYHPEHVTSDYEDEDEKGALDEPYSIKKLEELVKSSQRILAIGECGLDYHYFSENPDLDIPKAKNDQLQTFLEQSDLAARHNKALIVHSRDAGQDIIQAINDIRGKHSSLQIIIHGFSDSWQQAQAFLDLNCYLGIGGIVTFKPRKSTPEQDILSNIVKKMPLNRLLLETDCPWLAPVPVRGERNEPTHVRHIADFIANLHKISFAEISKITTENAQNAFNCEF